jgi:aminoglycoside/choline kinase family phosphotransferase
VHRDFQSTNILYSGDDRSKPWIIDYQGLRTGPAAYDIASLLFDPYVPMDWTDRSLIVDIATAEDGAPSREVVLLAAVQRLCQALGAFCRLCALGQTRFEKFIAPALEMLHRLAHEAGLPAVAEFVHGFVRHGKVG